MNDELIMITFVIFRRRVLSKVNILLACKTFNVREENANVFIAMDVNPVKLIWHERSFVRFRSNILNYLSGHEIR